MHYRVRKGEGGVVRPKGGRKLEGERRRGRRERSIIIIEANTSPFLCCSFFFSLFFRFNGSVASHG